MSTWLTAPYDTKCSQKNVGYDHSDILKRLLRNSALKRGTPTPQPKFDLCEISRPCQQ